MGDQKCPDPVVMMHAELARVPSGSEILPRGSQAGTVTRRKEVLLERGGFVSDQAEDKRVHPGTGRKQLVQRNWLIAILRSRNSIATVQNRAHAQLGAQELPSRSSEKRQRRSRSVLEGGHIFWKKARRRRGPFRKQGWETSARQETNTCGRRDR